MLLTSCHSGPSSCGRWNKTLWNGAQSQLMRTKHMDGLIRGESRWLCFFRWPADWLMMWVLAGDLLMGCLMRVDYTVCLSPSLHASHDNRVSVTPFNPITPTWSDTNSITAFLLATRSSLFPWFPDTHSVTSGLFFIAWWAGGLYEAVSLLLFFFLSFTETSSVFHPSSRSSVSRLSRENSEPLISKRQSDTPNLFL